MTMQSKHESFDQRFRTFPALEKFQALITEDHLRRLSNMTRAFLDHQPELQNLRKKQLQKRIANAKSLMSGANRRIEDLIGWVGGFAHTALGQDILEEVGKLQTCLRERFEYEERLIEARRSLAEGLSPKTTKYELILQLEAFVSSNIRVPNKKRAEFTVSLIAAVLTSAGMRKPVEGGQFDTIERNAIRQLLFNARKWAKANPPEESEMEFPKLAESEKAKPLVVKKRKRSRKRNNSGRRGEE